MNCPDNKSNLLLWGEYTLVTGAVAIPIWIFHYLVFGYLNLSQGLAGALMIALPFIFLPPRRRILALVPVWLIPIF